MRCFLNLGLTHNYLLFFYFIYVFYQYTKYLSTYKIHKINQTNYLAQHVESNVYVSLKIDANGNLLASREK